jgi:hypothetical protein
MGTVGPLDDRPTSPKERLLIRVYLLKRFRCNEFAMKDRVMKRGITRFITFSFYKTVLRTLLRDK